MSEPDLPSFHAREAARFRRLLALATTPAVKARLAEQAAVHEQIAEARERLSGRGRQHRSLVEERGQTGMSVNSAS